MHAAMRRCPSPSPLPQGFPPVLELPLPAVNCERVGLHHDGQTCYSGVEARQVPPEAWRALDAALHPALEGLPSGGNWLDGEQRARVAGRVEGPGVRPALLEALDVGSPAAALDAEADAPPPCSARAALQAAAGRRG